MTNLVYGKLVDGKYVYVKDLGKGRPPKGLVRCEKKEDGTITPVGRIVQEETVEAKSKQGMTTAKCGIKVVEE